LSRFVPKEIAWLHLDLAAGSRHGGLGHIATEITGFGVRYTLELLRRGWPPAAAPAAGLRAAGLGAAGLRTVRTPAAARR
jgi:hypothetical protein